MFPGVFSICEKPLSTYSIKLEDGTILYFNVDIDQVLDKRQEIDRNLMLDGSIDQILNKSQIIDRNLTLDGNIEQDLTFNLKTTNS